MLLSDRYAAEICILQFVRSPYQESRAILAVCASDTKTLSQLDRYAAVQENTWAFAGDAFLIDKDLETKSFSFLKDEPVEKATLRERIEANAALLRVPVTIFESNIFAVANRTERTPCYLCAKMRRGHLYSKAREMGCNKIALGHHFNDVIETVVMSMFFGGQMQSMPPKLHSRNFPGMELIRPLYMIHEEDIIAWARYNHLEFIQCACRFTEQNRYHEGSSKRQEVKTLLRELRKDNPDIEKSIFKSIHNLHLDTMVGYKTDGQWHTFLERYDK